MPAPAVLRRTQFSSCDDCRRSRVACDASAAGAADGQLGRCSRCKDRNRTCSFEWLQSVKRGTPRRSRRPKATRPPLDGGSCPSPGDSVNLDTARVTHRDHANISSDQESLTNVTVSTEPSPVHQSTESPARPPDHIVHKPDPLSGSDREWLQTIYLEGFEAVFGSWLGRYSCPFLFGQDEAVDKYVSISETCRQLDNWIENSDVSDKDTSQELEAQVQRSQAIEESLCNTIATFSIRWLPIASSKGSMDTDHSTIVQSMWRNTRRDMLRIINRASYRSMLALLLFALTPIPIGIPEEEESDGISGQSCVHAALQHVQALRARQRNLQFSGSKVSPSNPINSTPESMSTAGFIIGESIAYWAALTFDTSASLTLNSRPFLCSGLLGFGSELPWRLVRTTSRLFVETVQQWHQTGREITDERANQIIAAAATWKLLGWKLTANFKEALGDGHDESEIHKAFVMVLESIKEFDTIYRSPLEECQRKIQFLGQKTRLRWFSLMLHYHLSILMLVDAIEVTGRHDLLQDLADVSTRAENTVMNTLAFGLFTDITVAQPAGASNPGPSTTRQTSGCRVPIISIDPYPHHIVAGVQLVRKSIDRDVQTGKIAEETYHDLLSTLERVLQHLPQTSKSVQAARSKFRSTIPSNASLIRNSPFTAICIVGAGTQGRRLAFMWSSAGTDVHLIDGQPSQLRDSLHAIDLFRNKSHQKNPRWGRVSTKPPGDLATALRDSWLALECVPERLSLKRDIIMNLDSLAGDDTIIASNSSSYTCTEILKSIKLRNQRRFLSAHSYWPPETPQLEVMGHDSTDPACIEAVMEQSRLHGFSPFHVKASSMGYIYNRIWAAIKREALLTASEGVAAPEEIDNIFRGVLNTPRGPFELMDIVGLDVVMDIEENYAKARNNISGEPREFLRGYLVRGHLGVKSGKGFYNYAPE
ncbi:hypothetical protein B0I35DRAFT_400396 [Stachybotrys elegans]|uniref:Zn(2)-C6 fungal-type domain-containing protein n=1 Tax=Stachybotrys elegans TaxID=80388 RepID=A0A8K0SE89_9HYPO|nr:hypothetical protein B0I35DRAFT_400396 [Stachybotrys elegans]